MPYAFDGEREPLIFMRLYGMVSGDELELVLTDFDTLTTRERPFVVILDCSELERLERAQLLRFAGWLRSNFEVVARHLRGLAFVLTNAEGRMSLTTLMQLQRMPMPVQAVRSVEAGAEWARAKLHDGTIVRPR